MNRSATVGLVDAVFVLLAVAAPYVLVADPGTGLAVYYGAGPVGGHVVAVLALLQVVVLLAGEHGGADPVTAAGVATVVGVGAFALALAWAFAVEPDVVFSFPVAWMGWHRWAVVGLAALLAASSAAYARSTLS